MLTGPAGTVDDLPVKFRVMRVAQVRHDDLLEPAGRARRLPADRLLPGDGAHIRCEQRVAGVRLGNGGVFRQLACGARAGRDSGKCSRSCLPAAAATRCTRSPRPTRKGKLPRTAPSDRRAAPNWLPHPTRWRVAAARPPARQPQPRGHAEQAGQAHPGRAAPAPMARSRRNECPPTTA